MMAAMRCSSLRTPSSAKHAPPPTVNASARLGSPGWNLPRAPALAAPLGLGLAGGIAALALSCCSGPALAQDAAAMPGFSGVDDSASDLVQNLLAKSKENKAAYDQERLDRYYKRDWMINRIAGDEILPEPCDPRDPEFGADPKCVKLPRLPQDRGRGGELRTEDFAKIDGRNLLMKPPVPKDADF